MNKGDLFTIIGAKGATDNSYQSMIFRVLESCGKSMIAEIAFGSGGYSSFKTGERLVLNMDKWVTNPVTQEFLDAAANGPKDEDEDLIA